MRAKVPAVRASSDVRGLRCAVCSRGGAEEEEEEEEVVVVRLTRVRSVAGSYLTHVGW
jgi:hypothetical protein